MPYGTGGADGAGAPGRVRDADDHVIGLVTDLSERKFRRAAKSAVNT
jgi:hypothetical protein